MDRTPDQERIKLLAVDAVEVLTGNKEVARQRIGDSHTQIHQAVVLVVTEAIRLERRRCVMLTEAMLREVEIKQDKLANMVPRSAREGAALEAEKYKAAVEMETLVKLARLASMRPEFCLQCLDGGQVPASGGLVVPGGARAMVPCPACAAKPEERLAAAAAMVPRSLEERAIAAGVPGREAP